jgi:hypothetical protein
MNRYTAVMYDVDRDDVFLYPNESHKHSGNPTDVIAEVKLDKYLVFEENFKSKKEIEKYLNDCNGGYKYSYFIRFLQENNLKIKPEEKYQYQI